MKPIRFTAHALWKLGIAQEMGIEIDENSVAEAVRGPREVLLGYSGRSIAQVILDEAHLLRVVYEENDEIVLITLYPGRRQRYES